MTDVDAIPQTPSVKGVENDQQRDRALLARLVEMGGAGVMVVDDSGMLRLVNKEAERQCGLVFDPSAPMTATEWLQNCFQTEDGEPIPLEQCPLGLAVRGVATEKVRFSVQRTDGSRRILSGAAMPLRGADGSLSGGVLVMRDETEQRETERRLRLQATILRNVRDSIVVTDMNGKIVEWNEGARTIFGYSAEEVLGKSPAFLYPDLDAELFARDLDTIARGRDFIGEWKARRKDGSQAWVEITTTIMLGEASEPLGFIGIAKDVTDKKAAELGRARADQERAEALALAESASRAKDEFLAMLGHELRNPLSPIVTAMRLMKLKGDVASTREQQVIERQVEHLVRLVDDLLDVSRVTRGTFELKKERLDFAGVVAKAVEMAGPLLEQRQHHLHVNIHPMRLEADPVRLAQVIANLLMNAAKYTDPGGTIALNAWRDGSMVVILVKDNGMGIPRELLPRVFDLFTQGQRSTDRSQGGLGLGLTLVRRLVQMHGGTVMALSEGPGHGSEFVVRLPALLEMPGSAPASERPSPPDPLHKASTPRRVLIVDDNSDAAAMLADLLREAGHEVQIAEDGPRALKVIERFQPEVGLLDIGLPVMDGYELAGRLRAGLPSTLRLAAVTGYGQEHDRARSERAGFDQHFVKPVDPDLIIGYIEHG